MWHLHDSTYARSIDWTQVGRVLAAVITPVIAAIATYIAVAQHLINRRQYRLALFEKRMAVYTATMKMIASVMQSANPTLDECFQFIRDTRDNEFLFEPDVKALIDEVYRQATALHAYIAARPGTAAQRTATMEWFAAQMSEARKVFLRYLDFRKP